MKPITRVSIAAAIIAVAVVFGWKMQSEIPTESDRQIVEEFVHAYDTAFRTRDAAAYRSLFTSDFQTKGNPMALGDFPPETVERLIENVAFEMGDVTSTVLVTRVGGHGATTKRISFFVHSSYRGGETQTGGGLVVTFVQRDGKWPVSLMEQYTGPSQDSRYYYYKWWH